MQACVGKIGANTGLVANYHTRFAGPLTFSFCWHLPFSFSACMCTANSACAHNASTYILVCRRACCAVVVSGQECHSSCTHCGWMRSSTSFIVWRKRILSRARVGGGFPYHSRHLSRFLSQMAIMSCIISWVIPNHCVVGNMVPFVDNGPFDLTPFSDSTIIHHNRILYYGIFLDSHIW